MRRPEGAATIIGIGTYLPRDVVSNAELIKRTGIKSSDRGIRVRTGIGQRHFVSGDDEHPSDMAVLASRQALLTAGATGKKIHTLLVATDRPDYQSPSTASIVHGELNLPEHVLAKDEKAACAGGVMVLHEAAARVRDEGGQALAIATNTLSSAILVPPVDPRTVILFGDGAGAMVIEKRPESHVPVFAFRTIPNRAALGSDIGGERFVPEGPQDPRIGIRMDGKVVGATAVPTMTELAIVAAQKAGVYNHQSGRIEWDEIDLLVPHQGNGHLVAAVGKELGAPSEKLVSTIEHHGNTSATTIFLALDHALREGQAPPKARVLFTSFGAGFVAAAGIMNVDIQRPTNSSITTT